MNKHNLKTAFLEHDFERAQTLVEEWGSAVAARLKLASGDSEKRRIFDDALEFAQEHMNLARVIRAHISTELQDNTAAFLYQDSHPEQHCWHLNG